MLQWKFINFENRCLRWGKDKTAAGTGRVVPLSQRAVAALSFWATHFLDRKPEHYVFPAERYGASRDQFSTKAYQVAPAKPVGSIKEAWEAAEQWAAKILKGEDEEQEAETSRATDDKSAALPISRSPAHCGLPNAECWSSNRKGRQDCHYAVQVRKRVRKDIEIVGRVQYEGWKAPIYRTGAQSDTTATFQFTAGARPRWYEWRPSMVTSLLINCRERGEYQRQRN